MTVSFVWIFQIRRYEHTRTTGVSHFELKVRVVLARVCPVKVYPSCMQAHPWYKGNYKAWGASIRAFIDYSPKINKCWNETYEHVTKVSSESSMRELSSSRPLLWCNPAEGRLAIFSECQHNGRLLQVSDLGVWTEKARRVGHWLECMGRRDAAPCSRARIPR